MPGPWRQEDNRTRSKIPSVYRGSLEMGSESEHTMVLESMLARPGQRQGTSAMPWMGYNVLDSLGHGM